MVSGGLGRRTEIIQSSVALSKHDMQLAGEKFAPGAREILRMQGSVRYVRGRVSVAHGDGYLTIRRLVFCRKPRLPFRLGQFFTGRRSYSGRLAPLSGRFVRVALRAIAKS